MKASEMMTRDVQTVTEGERCDAAARVMFENDVGSVPVVGEGGGLVGIVTDRDLARIAYEKRTALHELALADAMSRDLVVAQEDDEVEQVANLMQEHQIRRIPVVGANGSLAGIIALADIARMPAVGTEDVVDEEEVVVDTLEAVSQPDQGR